MQKDAVEKLISRIKCPWDLRSCATGENRPCDAAMLYDEDGHLQGEKLCRDFSCIFRHECERYFLYGRFGRSSIIRNLK